MSLSIAHLGAYLQRMVDWIISDGLTAYDDALAFMEARVNAIIAGAAD